MRMYGTLSRELSCSKSHSAREQQVQSRWQFSSQRAERLACASHCTPLLSRRSSSSVVRASLAQSATSIAALPRCQGSPLLTAWMERCSSTARERLRLLQPLPSPPSHNCAERTQRAQVKARVRLRVGLRVRLRDDLMRRARLLALLFRRCGRSRRKHANAAVGRFAPAVRGILSAPGGP